MKTIYNPYKKLTQKWYLLEHFQRFKRSISPVEAETVYRIRRLASRICEMKQEGWNIQTSLKYDATGQRYARYSLKK